MKVAIVHDYIKEYGGAERVLETLLEIYPNADVFTSLFAPEFLGPHRSRFEKYNIKTTFLNYIPFRHKLISPLRLLSPLAFSSLDLSNYDVVIVSQTGAYFPNLSSVKGKALRVKAGKKGPIHICYTHTPPRYLYGYATARDWKKHKSIAVVAGIANHFLRMIDYNASKNVDFFIANSEEVAARIKKFYRRDSTVIYPPVNVSFPQRRESIKPGSPIKVEDDKLKNYYLTGGRLARAKGIDVIVKAFNTNGLPLKIFGKGFAGYEEELKKISNFQFPISNNKSSSEQSESSPLRQGYEGQGSLNVQKFPRPSEALTKEGQQSSNNIEFVGEVSDEEKSDLMRNAKAFIFASYDEDFGITPVEAMSVGTPVIAYRSGGVKETVLQSRTGLFYDDNSPEVLNTAIEKFEKTKIDPRDCIKQAEKFSKEKFKKSILEFVKACIRRSTEESTETQKTD